MTNPGADPFDAAYSRYLEVRGGVSAEGTVAALDLQAVEESGYPLPQVLLGALAAGQRLSQTPAEAGSAQDTLQRANDLQAAAGFLDRHWPSLGLEVKRVVAAARNAGNAAMSQVLLSVGEAPAATSAVELPARLRRAGETTRPGTLYGYRAFIHMAAELPGPAGPTFGYSDLRTLLNSVYNTAGAPPQPVDVFQTLVNPLMSVGILEMVGRRRYEVEYRLASSAGRDQHPVRNRPGIPPRLHFTPAESLILAAQLHRLEDEFTESGLPTIDPALVTDLAGSVEPSLRMEDSQLLEARRLVADKAGRLNASPKFLLLLKESLPGDDPRQHLFNYIAELPASRMRLFKGYVGESNVAVTFAEIRTAIERGVGPVVDDVEVRRDIT